MVDSPGGLTNVIQVFSLLNISMERLEYTTRACSAAVADLEARFNADERTADLLRRKLARLVEVLSVDALLTECAMCNEYDRHLL